MDGETWTGGTTRRPSTGEDDGFYGNPYRENGTPDPLETGCPIRQTPSSSFLGVNGTRDTRTRSRGTGGREYTRVDRDRDGRTE